MVHLLAWILSNTPLLSYYQKLALKKTPRDIEYYSNSKQDFYILSNLKYYHSSLV